MKTSNWFVLLFITAIVGCSEDQKATKNENGDFKAERIEPIAKEKKVVDLNSFTFKNLEAPLSQYDITKIKQTQNMSDREASLWIRKITPEKIGSPLKKISYQFSSEASHVVLIGNLFEEFEDEGKPYYAMDQYLLSIDKTDGKLLDFLKVQGYISGDELGDSIVIGKGLILNIETKSIFKNNQVHVDNKVMYLNPPDSHDEKDVNINNESYIYYLDAKGKFKIITAHNTK